ncbi:hypothetical protein OIU76_007191 [Salix suchowensis]|uniref:Uncharacterized protein n=1 Tax=Salix koriyanagi TaxID=2511006 RepID=A0A9Q0YS70_9ROSI|nr:hypothetical protein OIU76_007191 [Salix suchowensis]KAJ6709422.1 hypothetical protein OIU74_010512 [Salix koriyanagi]
MFSNFDLYYLYTTVSLVSPAVSCENHVQILPMNQDGASHNHPHPMNHTLGDIHYESGCHYSALYQMTPETGSHHPMMNQNQNRSHYECPDTLAQSHNHQAPVPRALMT